MSGVNPVRNIVRIDNVETQPAERITANDEDRQRQGFEIQTVFAWPRRDGRLDVTSATANDEHGPAVLVDYASGATISRVNKGLRRRSEKSIFGFGIDPSSGRWTGGINEDEDNQPTPDGPIVQRIVPIVEDNKNAALLRMAADFESASALPTLQHAFTRGLENIFQLEEGEILTEPVPSRDARKAILAFEATEGGAGVLSRLVAEPTRIAEIARTALSLMHYQNVEEAIASGDVEMLASDPDAECVKGCYRCLLSYYNQPDHELIDRTDREVLEFLIRMARTEVAPARGTHAEGPESWPDRLLSWGLPVPDAKPLAVGEREFPLVWRSHLVVASNQELTTDEIASLDFLGFALVRISEDGADRAPADLARLLGGK
jgi:hypothetical protein